MKPFCLPVVGLVMAFATFASPVAAIDLDLFTKQGSAALASSGQPGSLLASPAVSWTWQDQHVVVVPKGNGGCPTDVAFISDCPVSEGNIYTVDARDTADLLGIPRPKAQY